VLNAQEKESHMGEKERTDYIDIKFQEGPIDVAGVNGCHIEDVIDLLVDRLRGFNDGDFRCRENSLAITHLEEAGLWLVKRRMNRIEQGVEGKYLPHVS
jgi:hypothetical protein